MRRKKIRATKRNKEIIKESRKANRYLRSIGLTCKKCDIQIRVNTTQPELYTKEVRENYICLNCSIPSGYITVFQKGCFVIKAQVSLRVQNLFEKWGFKRR